MTKQELIDFYLSLDEAHKTKFLVRASHSLTVGMRGLYDPTSDTPSDPKAFQGANELQHHFSAEAGHKLSDQTGYPDDVLLSIPLEKAEYYGITSELEYALESAIRHSSSRLM